ncbi:hypothetical protein MTR67_052594 [Solanum verrucosum]|uniref:Uncharacterized protein n=1 Tax=Solanum verrucosum TaxID=315347 RepID=A0AAF1A3M9_SOLVR|nr:hypothetical protein MTR67_052594 [Solanum verrucosum]
MKLSCPGLYHPTIVGIIPPQRQNSIFALPPLSAKIDEGHPKNPQKAALGLGSREMRNPNSRKATTHRLQKCDRITMNFVMGLSQTSRVYPVVHISLLKKCAGDPTSRVPLESLGIKD